VGAPEHDTLTQTAWAGAAKKNSAFQFRYQRLKTRRAVKRATIAVAHAQLGSGGRKNPAADRSWGCWRKDSVYSVFSSLLLTLFSFPRHKKE